MSRFPQLRRDARRPGPHDSRGYHIGPVLALAEDPSTTPDAPASTADVYLFGSIGGWLGVTAKDFVRDVGSLDVEQIVLHLNTPGGDAIEGVAIANVLRGHTARVVVRVDGIAASAGSVVAMAGDEVVMGLGSEVMVHDPWCLSIGDAGEMQACARMLDTTANSLASTLAARAGGTTEEWREVMRAETWYTAEEAVAAGLADRVAAADETGTAEGEQITPGTRRSFWDLWDSLGEPDRFDLSAFAYAGREHAPAPAMPGRQTPAASAAGTRTEKRSGMSPTFLEEIRTRLGTADDADEPTLLAALDEALAEQSTDPPAPQAGTQLPDGVVPVDRGVLEQLQSDAQLGRDAHARQQREDRERLVAAAIGDGRISPATRDGWLQRLATDPSGAEASTLAQLTPGLATPVDGERGHASQETAPDDGWFPQFALPQSTTKEG